MVDTLEFEKNTNVDTLPVYKDITCIMSNPEQDRWKSLSEKYEKMMDAYVTSDCNPKLYQESLSIEYSQVRKQMNEANNLWASFLTNQTKIQIAFPNEMLFFGHIVFSNLDAVEN